MQVPFYSSTAPTDLSDANNQAWLPESTEGELGVDIFRENDHLVVRAMVAGVRPEDLEIAIHHDMLTIRGKREESRTIHEDEWFARECYWGSFSRSLILPMDVATEQADASLKNGILEIRMPIRHHEQRLKIRAMDEQQS